jgi:NAD(P)-dependent dehydrogenase (short-subunit alcohol dehydrogenase family)
MQGKTIIVTGVASGIGAKTAALLAARGATIIGLDQKPPADPPHRFVVVDLAAPESIEAAVARIEEGLDGICNVAGVPPTLGTDRVLRVNFLGLRMLTEQLGPRLKPGASIVNVASLAGINWRNRWEAIRSFLALRDFAEVPAFCARHGVTDDNCYAFSKEALIAWTIAASRSWQERGVRLNAISPGPVQTPILADFRATIGGRFQGVVSTLERPAATAEEIAAVIAFLVSPDSAWIRGTNLPVDGGAAAEVVMRALPGAARPA